MAGVLEQVASISVVWTSIQRSHSCSVLFESDVSRKFNKTVSSCKSWTSFFVLYNYGSVGRLK